jgi:hypothetical protein
LTKIGEVRTALKSPKIPSTSELASGGTSTSSITWVKNVAFAINSTSRNLDVDCGISLSKAERR